MEILKLSADEKVMLTGEPRGCLDDCEHPHEDDDAIVTGFL